MRWNFGMIKRYEEDFEGHMNYEVSPFEKKDIPVRRSGTGFKANFEDQAILNAEFCLSMRMLNKRELYAYKELYMAGCRIPIKYEEDLTAAKRKMREFLMMSNYKERSRMSEAYKR